MEKIAKKEVIDLVIDLLTHTGKEITDEERMEQLKYASLVKK